MTRGSTSSAGPVVGLADLTPAALTQILRAELGATGSVSGIRTERFGLGQAADTFRLYLSYNGAPDTAPKTLVAKVASDDVTSRQFARDAGLYEREVNFYRQLADHLAVRTPRTLHAHLADDARFAILMEDLSPAVIVDQTQGCPPERAAVALEQAAALHSSSWRRSDLQALPWLRSLQPALQATIEHLGGLYAQFRATYADLVDSSVFDVTDALVQVIPAWHKRTLDGYCLWHHDFRPDNMLFDAKGGSEPLVVVDWQSVSLGPGIADVSYFLGCGLTVDDRRAHERQLLRVYYEALRSGGIEELTFEDCWNSYLDHAVAALFMAIHASVRVERTERGDAMWKSWLERAASQLTDHDALGRH